MRHVQERAVEGAAIKAEINVTPLVDVCLVLLIIFMVVTPLIRQGVDLALPETAAPGVLGESPARITVSLRSDGSVWLDAMRIEPAALAGAVRRQREGRPEATFLVRGDRSLPYAEVRAVLRRLSSAGVTAAELATVRRSAATQR